MGFVHFHQNNESDSLYPLIKLRQSNFVLSKKTKIALSVTLGCQRFGTPVRSPLFRGRANSVPFRCRSVHVVLLRWATPPPSYWRSSLIDWIFVPVPGINTLLPRLRFRARFRDWYGKTEYFTGAEGGGRHPSDVLHIQRTAATSKQCAAHATYDKTSTADRYLVSGRKLGWLLEQFFSSAGCCGLSSKLDCRTCLSVLNARV